MLLAYLDESYRKGSEYWLGAALVAEDRVHALSRDVRDCSRRLPIEFGLPHDVELHGYDIFHGERQFARIKEAGQPGVLLGLLRAGLRALAAARPELILAGVRWSEDPKVSLEAHRMAAFERLLIIMEDRARQRDQRCLLIADREETTEHAAREAVRIHQDRSHTDHNDCRIIENVLFVASHDSPGVQATDLATFCFHRHRAALDTDPRAIKALNRCMRIIEPLIWKTDLGSAPERQMHEEPPKGGSTAR